MGIIKFGDRKEDLNQINNLSDFIKIILKTLLNILTFLDKNCYFAMVICDVYKESEVKPLGFYVMDCIKRNFKAKLKKDVCLKILREKIC